MDRTKVLAALAALPDISFVLAVAAARGAVSVSAAAIVDDPTAERAFMAAATEVLVPVVGEGGQ